MSWEVGESGESGEGRELVEVVEGREAVKVVGQVAQILRRRRWRRYCGVQMTKQEHKELTEFISQHPEKDQLSEIVEKIFRAKPRQRASKEYDESRSSRGGFMRRLGSLFSRN